MKIIELNIIQFGKFSDLKLSLESGFNLIEGDNESGKSTLQAFIKYVFYGLPRKNPNVLIGERERALSWLGGIAAGSITLESDGKKYRIERSGRMGARGAYNEESRTIDLSDGSEVYRGEVPGELFFGIDSAAYDSVCNIRQLECTSVDGNAVRSAIENILSSGDENTSVKSAQKLLDAERKRLLHKNGKGGSVYEAGVTLEALESEYESACRNEAENIKQTEELERTERQLEAARRSYETSCVKCDLFEDVKRLEKFAELKKLREKGISLAEQRGELTEKYGSDRKAPTHSDVAEIKSASDALKRDAGLLASAKKENEAAETLGSGVEVSRDVEDLLYEFGSAKNVINNLRAKEQKRTRLLIASVVSFILSGVLLVGAISLAVIDWALLAGALTVSFFGIVAVFVGAVLLGKARAAGEAMLDIISRVGDGFSEKDVDQVASVLIDLEGGVSLRRQNAYIRDSAGARLAAAEENHARSLGRARELLSLFDVAYIEGEEAQTLSSLAETLSAYISALDTLDSSINENKVLIRSLSAELERYSEKDIAEKITPEIEDAIRRSSFEELKKERDASLNKINVLNGYKASLERQLGILESSKRAPNEIFPEIERQKKRLSDLKLRLDAIRLASEMLEKSFQKLKSEVTPRIKSESEKNMAHITGGKYSEMFLDEDLALTVLAGGETRPIDALSKGSCDAAYLSVRFALLDVMCGDKKPPLILDESLSQLDDGRASNVISAISHYCDQNAQAILFTCQKRDAALSSKITSFNFIQL